MEAQYSYRPIHHHSDIRVLELQPSDPGNPGLLRAELTVVSLKEEPFYEAISYTWGEPVFSEHLYLDGDGAIMMITLNLAAGLRQFRLPDRVRKLWVDAICINQKDNTEKSAQVSLMGKIYRNTQKVLVWLGEGNEELHHATECLKGFAQEPQKYGIDPASPFDETNFLASGDKHIAVASLALSKESDLEKLLPLFRHPWFNRLWIVQEFALARQLSLNLGSDYVDIRDFEVAMAVVMKIVCEVNKSGRNWGAMFQQALILSMERISYEENLEVMPYQRSLMQLVWDHHNRAHTKAHDLFYALLGLMAREDDVKIEVDYELSVEDLFLQFAWKYLEIGNIRILSQGVEIETRKKHAGFTLPSWVPDWRRRRSPSLSKIPENFSAASASEPSLVLYKDNMNTVGVRGVLIDVLTNAVDFESLADNTHGESDSKSMLGQLAEIEGMLRDGCSDSPYNAGETLSIALASTLIMGARRSDMNILMGESKPTECFDRWMDFQDYALHDVSQLLPEKQKSLEKFGDRASRANAYLQALRMFQYAQRFLITQSGFIGIGSLHSRPGDVVVVFDGAEIPSVLRPAQRNRSQQGSATSPSDGVENGGTVWELIGECYLHGFMDNEALKPEFKSNRQTFFLV